MRRADIVGTGGNKPPVHPVMAEMTLLCLGFILVKRHGIVGTRFDTGLTSGTQMIINDNKAVFSLADGFFRTSLDTRRIIAMPANADIKGKIQLAVN
jgi:hypothetical protein